MSDRRHRRPARTLLPLVAVLAATGLSAVAWAQVPPPRPAPPAAPAAPAAPASPGAASTPTPEPPAPPVVNSAMDDRLFYQLLLGEIALTQGDAGSAYEWMLDAARRTRDEGLFRRAVDIALQARAGDQALAAARAWRLARPESLDALRMQLQILMALGRTGEVTEPLRSLLQQTPAAERGGLISVLPRFLQRAPDKRQVATLMEDVLKPYRDAAPTRIPVRVALGRAWLEAQDADRALALATEAQRLEPDALGPALLALELMRERPQAEQLVQDHLKHPKAEQALRLAYVRVLTGAQRYADAIVQLEAATRAEPDTPGPYLTLGALHLELKHPKEGEAALLRYVALVEGQAQAAKAASAASAASATPEPGAAPPEPAPGALAAGDDDGDDTRPDEGLIQAWLMLAQSAEQRGDFAAAERWLARIESPARLLEVQSRRASILARQGRVDEARALIQALPERRPQEARAKLAAEAALLREARRWQAAYEVLGRMVQRFGEDPDLLYEQAMMAEKNDRLADMERLLRRVIELKPDNAHAHNALGYSLADRNQRLPEARALIQRALELAPGDPFITDSLGWVEFRMGNREEALRLLRQAYGARPDPEIGAHLGEVLWSLGQRDEARRIWLESQRRDAANEVLRETLARLRVRL